jgi:hypothetical protein
MGAGTLPPARGPGRRQRGQLAMADEPGARTWDQGAKLADQLQAINSISVNRLPAGAGSRGILRQLSEIDQAPGAQLQPASWPLIADQGPGEPVRVSIPQGSR